MQYALLGEDAALSEAFGLHRVDVSGDFLFGDIEAVAEPGKHILVHQPAVVVECVGTDYPEAFVEPKFGKLS